MSLVDHIAMVPRAAWPLGVGLLLNSTLLFGNVGLSIAGPLPIVQDKLGKNALGKKDRIRIWALFYKAMAGFVVPATVLTTLLHLSAAYITPSRQVRNLALTAGTVSLSVLPYTFAFMMPTIKQLLDWDTKAALTPAEERDVAFYIDKWGDMHKFRFAIFGSAWAAGLGALMGVVGRW